MNANDKVQDIIKKAQESAEKARRGAEAKALITTALLEQRGERAFENFNLVYDGLGLYGVVHGLGYQVHNRAQVGRILETLPPDPLDRVYYGGEHLVGRGQDGKRQAYRNFWPSDYAGGTKRDEHVVERFEVVPFYYKVEGYSHGSSWKVKWNTRLEGLERPLFVQVELRQDPGGFSWNVRRNPMTQAIVARSCVPNDKIPAGHKEGFWGNIASDSYPHVTVYWTDEQVGADILAHGWEYTADACLEVTDAELVLAGRAEQEDPGACYHVKMGSDGVSYECGRPTDLTIRLASRPEVERRICKEHTYHFTGGYPHLWEEVKEAQDA